MMPLRIGEEGEKGCADADEGHAAQKVSTVHVESPGK